MRTRLLPSQSAQAGGVISNEPKECVIRQPVRIADKGRLAGAEAACPQTLQELEYNDSLYSISTKPAVSKKSQIQYLMGQAMLKSPRSAFHSSQLERPLLR